jgi:hypothetical protein
VPSTTRSDLLGLWVVLGVLAVVVVAVVATLLVVQPWSGADDPSAWGDETSSAEQTDTTGTTGTTDPSDRAVRGDVDGDGLGDVVGRYYDDTEARLVLHNANGTFRVDQQPVDAEEHLFVGDFDGDGGNEVASWSDDSGTLHVTIEASAVPELTQDFELWFKVQDIKAVFGDFDGDGLVDILAYGQQHRSQVSVWMLRNNSAGFEQPAKWASLPNATYGSTELIVGDFNGDGSDDAMAVVPNEPLVKGDFDDYYWYGDFGIVPLIAEPGAFGRGGISTVDAELYDQERAVGDFDGDGKDTLVADNYLDDSFVLYEYDGSGLRPTGATVGYSMVGDGVMDAVTATDLDGDRLDDLVFTSVDVDDYSFFGVWTAAGDSSGGLGAPAKWADLPDCKGDYCDVDYFPAG